MHNNYFEDRVFENQDYTKVPPAGGVYEGCSFIQCNFSGAQLGELQFIDCSFTGCNLGMANLSKTVIRDVKFTDCKLLGLHFYTCGALFSATFSGCTLHLSAFTEMNLKKMQFSDSILHEVDFSGADLTQAIFDRCDLAGAIFDATKLEKADFRTAQHYVINPERNRIKKARFSLPEVTGLLYGYDIVIE